MGDDDEGALGRAQPVDAVRDDPQRVDVEAGIGLVEHPEPRLEQRHLQNLVAFLFAAGEADIDRAAQHLAVDGELLCRRGQPLLKLRNGELGLAALLALRVERGTQELDGRDAGNFQRILERQEQARGGALVGRHVEQVLAVEAHRTCRRRVVGPPGEHIGQRRFSRAVRPHDGMHLAGVHGEVEAPQNGLAVDLDVQIFNVQKCHFLFPDTRPSASRDASF